MLKMRGLVLWTSEVLSFLNKNLMKVFFGEGTKVREVGRMVAKDLQITWALKLCNEVKSLNFGRDSGLDFQVGKEGLKVS
jgi:hypothetical protein